MVSRSGMYGVLEGGTDTTTLADLSTARAEERPLGGPLPGDYYTSPRKLPFSETSWTSAQDDESLPSPLGLYSKSPAFHRRRGSDGPSSDYPDPNRRAHCERLF